MSRKASLRRNGLNDKKEAKGTSGAEPATLRDSKYKDPEAGGICLDQRSTKSQWQKKKKKKMLSEMDVRRWGGAKQWRKFRNWKVSIFSKII